MVVTRAEGNKIYELNGRPAWEEYTRRLELDASAACADTIPIGALAEALSPALAEEYGNDQLNKAYSKTSSNVIWFDVVKI